jgi:YbgC/YbaW family acyl-CoA thioester hydrolase
MTPFRVSRRVEFHETDMAGIVHFAKFFRYMEYAEVEFLRSRGLSVKLTWEGRELGFPRVSATCDYVKPARFDEVIDIAVTLDRVGQKSVTFVFEFTRAGEVLARGKTTSVCCEVRGDHALHAVEIPASYRARIESHE